MADVMNRGRRVRAWFWREEGARRREPLDILWREVIVFKTDTTKMRRMIAITFFQQLTIAVLCIRWTFISVSAMLPAGLPGMTRQTRLHEKILARLAGIPALRYRNLG